VLKKANEILQAFAKCETIAQKDSVCTVYGIERPKVEKDTHVVKDTKK